jgi:hypothetical protein
VTSTDTPVGRVLFGARMLSFGLSHAAGSRIFLNHWFDPAARQWQWNPATLDGFRQWSGNLAAVVFQFANAAGQSATISNTMAQMRLYRTGKNIDAVAGRETPKPAEAVPQQEAASVPREAPVPSGPAAPAPAPADTPAPAAAADYTRPLRDAYGWRIGTYKATELQPWIVRFAKGLGNAEAVIHGGRNDDGEPMLRPSLFKRLPQYASWGDTTGLAALTISDLAQGAMYAKAGQWDLVPSWAAKVLCDIGAVRGLQKEYLAEYASNRGMGPAIYHSRLTNFLNAPLGEARLHRVKVSEAWIRRGWPPLVLLAGAVAGRVLAEEWSTYEKGKKGLAGQPAVPGAPAATPTPPVAGPPLPSPSPGKSPAPPAPPSPPQRPKSEYRVVDGDVWERSCFTCMAEAKAKRDGVTYNQALSQLFNLNPRYKRSLMDGYVDPIRLDDPDTLNDGTKIKVGPAS